MIHVRLRLRDYLDLDAIAAARVELLASVVVRYPEQSADGRLTLNYQRYGSESVVTESDAAGRIEQDIDLSAMFERVRDVRKYDAIAIIDARIELAGFSRFFSLYLGPALAEQGTDPQRGILQDGDTLEWEILVDLAKSIVGETGPTSTALLFALTDNSRGGSYECHLFGADLRPADVAELYALRAAIGGETGGTSGSAGLDDAASPLALAGVLRDRHRASVSFEEAGWNTAVARFDGLRPGQIYRYELRRLAVGDGQGPDSERVVASGTVRTPADDVDSVRFVFGSCHLAVVPDDDPSALPLERWQRLAERDDYDFLMLIGDQVYADQAPGHDRRGGNLLRWFVQLYHTQWVYRPIRQVLRRTPTYMIFDDHEVDDDWGVDPVDEEVRRAGLIAYRMFQESHGPAGRSDDETHHYSFSWGPMSCFVLDGRSRRTLLAPGDGAEEAAVAARQSVVLGETQLRDLERWASGDALNADLIVIVASVPIAFLPVEQIRELGEELVDEGKKLGTLAGVLAGGVAGGLAGGPLGGLAGIFVGGLAGRHFVGEKAKDKVDAAGLGDLSRRDLRDMWTWGPNQPDLRRVLDVAFRLANDSDRDGRAKRAVVFLGGDVHAGALHHVVSMATGKEGGPDYSSAPLAFQVISSAISKPPTLDPEFSQAVRHIREGVGVGLIDLIASLEGADIDAEELVERIVGNDDPASFPLDRDLGDDPRFGAEFVDLLAERNYGEVAFSRTGDRRYEVALSVHGAGRSIHDVFDIDLKARRVLPLRLRRVRGTVRWMRVHRLGTGFGHPESWLGEELIVRLDSTGDDAFGLTLRDDDDMDAHQAALELLRTSLRRGVPLDLEYEPTSPGTGRILRVELSS